MAITAAGVALWVWDVDTDEFTMDEQGFRLWRMPRNVTTISGRLPAYIHPADSDG